MWCGPVEVSRSATSGFVDTAFQLLDGDDKWLRHIAVSLSEQIVVGMFRSGY